MGERQGGGREKVRKKRYREGEPAREMQRETRER